MTICPYRESPTVEGATGSIRSSGLATLSFALFAYAAFLAAFLYLVGFVADLSFLPSTVDRGGQAPVATAVLIDLSLIAAFGAQHSSMARAPFKRWITKTIPEGIERSLYVLSASFVLALVFLFWRPIGDTLWLVNGAAATALWILSATGWMVVLLSTFLINHFELFGLQQAWCHVRGQQAGLVRLRQPLFYKVVRHPLYLGFIIAFWATPKMSAGHALFAAGMTAYVLFAIRLEERDLVSHFGDDYERYQRDVGMLLPKPNWRNGRSYEPSRR